MDSPKYRIARRVGQIPEWPLTTGTTPTGGKRNDVKIRTVRFQIGRHIFKFELITISPKHRPKDTKVKDNNKKPPSNSPPPWNESSGDEGMDYGYTWP